MPGWSTTIASEFVELAVRDADRLDQAKLQKLVYIAHGLNLAITGQPLTGDRPEAWPFGPIYHRLANALRSAGNEALTADLGRRLRILSEGSDLDSFERDLISRVHKDYRRLTNRELSQITRRGQSPWAVVYADGQGHLKDIPHNLIREQFVELVEQSKTAPNA